MNDPVNHPAHYTDGKYEVIDFIESWTLGFHYGNAVKYISRAGKKDPAKKREDLEKAIWYLNRSMDHDNMNFVRKRSGAVAQAYPINIVDYCHDKGLSENLAHAVFEICVNDDAFGARRDIWKELDELEDH